MSELIVMLTHNDVTVPDAMETFLACKDLPVKYWGFKDHGMEPDLSLIHISEPTRH